MTLQKTRYLLEEVYRIGFRAFAYRLWMLFTQKVGIDVISHPIVSIDDKYFNPQCKDYVPLEPQEFCSWWLKQPNFFFVESIKEAKEIIQTCLDSDGKRKLIERGIDASRGKIFAFRCWPADFEASR